MAVSLGCVVLIPDWGWENFLQTIVVILGPHLTTWWCYSLTVKKGAFSAKSWTASEKYSPKSSQKALPLNSRTTQEANSSLLYFFPFFCVCVSAMLSSCQGCDATLQKLLLANTSVHSMYK